MGEDVDEDEDEEDVVADLQVHCRWNERSREQILDRHWGIRCRNLSHHCCWTRHWRKGRRGFLERKTQSPSHPAKTALAPHLPTEVFSLSSRGSELGKGRDAYTRKNALWVRPCHRISLVQTQS